VGTEYLPIPSPKGGAIEKWIFEVSKSLSKRHEVFVISPIGKGLPNIEVFNDNLIFWRTPIINFGKKIGSVVTAYEYFFRVALAIKKIAPEVVHFHARPHLIPLIKKMIGCSCIVSAHSDISGLSPSRFDRKIALNGLMSASFIHVVSNFIKKTIKGELAEEHPPIRTIYNGVDYFRYTYEKDLDSLFRSRFGMDSKTVILFVGRIEAEKGIHTLLDAFELLMRSKEDLALVLVGPLGGFGYEKLGSYQTWIRERIRFLGRDRVLATGAVSEEELIAFYSLADIFVYPSVFQDPSPMAPLEAMSFGKPVVTSSVGGIPELVENQRTGLLVSPSNPYELANAIMTLAQDPAKRISMGREGRRKVLERFNWKTVAQEIEKLYFAC